MQNIDETGHVQLTDMGLAAEIDPEKAAHHYDDIQDHLHEDNDGDDGSGSPTMAVILRSAMPCICSVNTHVYMIHLLRCK